MKKGHSTRQLIIIKNIIIIIIIIIIICAESLHRFVLSDRKHSCFNLLCALIYFLNAGTHLCFRLMHERELNAFALVTISFFHHCAGFTESMWSLGHCRLALEAIDYVLYKECGFHPNAKDYYNPQNSFLEEVGTTTHSTVLFLLIELNSVQSTNNGR